jgi:nicotinamidase-related amidase
MEKVGRTLLLVDVIKDFLHEDGDRLLESYRERHPALVAALRAARAASEPVVYANDIAGTWDSDTRALLRWAVEEGRAGDLVAEIAPSEGDVFVLKPGYSAFEGTPLEQILRERLQSDHLAVAGTATEMCVFQTVEDALRADFQVTVLADACATVDPENERLALDFLERVEGVEIVRG